MKPVIIEYCKGKMFQYFVRIKAGNGKIIFTSETYLRKESARKAVAALKRGIGKEVENW